MIKNKPTLLVLLGPTGVGKTDISIRLAEEFSAPIVSSDSRQFYRELKIGTAAPTNKELSRVKHYFIGSHSIHDLYNAGQYELDVIELLDDLFAKHKVVMLVGGSMMYIDAVCKGIDNIPTVDETTRKYWKAQYNEKGLEFIQSKLKELDPMHYEEVDLNNYKRILHALEICTISNQPFSDLRTGKKKERPFNIIKIGLNRPKDELNERINLRVDKMIKDGLIDEAKQFYEYRHLNTLNTVGYKELYEYMSGDWSLDLAIEKIKTHSRRYAKRQITWFKKDNEIIWFHPEQEEEITNYVKNKIEEKC